MNKGKTRPLNTGIRRWTPSTSSSAITVLAANLVAGGWGGVPGFASEPVGRVLVRAALRAGRGGRAGDDRRRPAAARRKAPTDLHYLYGVLPLVVSLTAEAIRSGAAERELEGLDFDSLPRARQQRDRAGDRPPRDRDHGRLGAGHRLPGPAGGRDDAADLAHSRALVGSAAAEQTSGVARHRRRAPTGTDADQDHVVAARRGPRAARRRPRAERRRPSARRRARVHGTSAHFSECGAFVAKARATSSWPPPRTLTPNRPRLRTASERP